MFIDSCVVGVNVYGSSPNRFVKERRISKEMRVTECMCPGLLIGVMICLVIWIMYQDFIVVAGVDSHWFFGFRRRRVMINRAGMSRGVPIRLGIMNWSNRLVFMVRVMFWWFVDYVRRGHLLGLVRLFGVGG